jgi:hypothetical protein
MFEILTVIGAEVSPPNRQRTLAAIVHVIQQLVAA